MIEALDILRKNKKRILVFGDIMLDRYIYGNVSRISPEAPIPVLLYEGEKNIAGGAANVAANLVALGAEVSVLSAAGTDAAGDNLISLLKRVGVDVQPVYRDSGRKTTLKTRVVSHNQQLLRIDDEDAAELSNEVENLLKGYINDNIDRFDSVLVSDYGKGAVTAGLCRYIIEAAERYGIKVLIDPKSRDYEKYRGAYLIKPNKKELSVLFDGKTGSVEEIVQSVRRIKEELKVQAFLVTTGEDGKIIGIDEQEQEVIVTAGKSEVSDVTGAGDTVFSVLGICAANGISLSDSMKLANTAAGIEIRKPGVAVVTLDEIQEELECEVFRPESKIITGKEALKNIIARARNKNKKVVFTNGCFDILHFGHVSYLSTSRSFGDLLIVGVNSDASVKRIKGENRPIVGERDRAGLLASLQCIDYVVVFDEDTPEELIREIQPDVLVKGADWSIDKVVGREIVEARGGRVELVKMEEGLSTTNIIGRINDAYGSK